jgi:hypothetical protein
MDLLDWMERIDKSWFIKIKNGRTYYPYFEYEKGLTMEQATKKALERHDVKIDDEVRFVPVNDKNGLSHFDIFEFHGFKKLGEIF